MSRTQAMKRVPVTILTGFLGAGKTTLLNRILTENHGKRIAVIENEFGEIGIDQALVINAEEEIFEMNNGCICCTVRGDLIRILGNLMRRRDKFDHILVETTGMADPGPVAQTFFVDETMREQFSLDGIVTLVDAKHVLLHLTESNECKEQIAFADVIVLNKADLVPSSELDALEARIRSMNAMARFHRAHNADVPVDAVLDIGGFDLDRALVQKPTFLEPEYPFEWAGLYELAEGKVSLRLKEGLDESLSLVLLPVPSAREVEKEAAESAMHAFAGPSTRVASGDEITASPSPWVIDLRGKGAMTFPVRVPQSGTYGLFTEHLPEEVSLVVRNEAGEILPVASRQFAAGHEHDATVSSVGIEVDGAVDGERLNKWMSRLLREHGADIFRMKGILNIQGNENRFVFQGVHMLFDGREDKAWGEGKRSNALVFIGRKLDRRALDEGFRACLV